MGTYLRLRATPDDDAFWDLLLHPAADGVEVMTDKGEWIRAETPRPDETTPDVTPSAVREGMVVEARDRLWRVDAIDDKEKTIQLVSIDGLQARCELYSPIEEIVPASFPPPEPDRVGDPKYQRMLLQSLSFSLLHSSTVLTGLQKSSVIPMPFQLVPVIMALNLPKARLLLADDVGLGKTIEAGLILSELASRNLAHRVLIVTPANLCEQWQDTMNRFFHMDFRIMSRRHRKVLERELMVGGNPWLRYPKLIVSIDYVKQDSVLPEALRQDWDLVIIDEAHKVARPHQSSPSSDSSMKRYQFGKKIAEKTNHLLLLTATPHNGYRDCFGSLLSLLNPDIVRERRGAVTIDKDIARNHVCQRRRSDVEEWFKESDEKSPFPKPDKREEPVQMTIDQERVMQELGVLTKHIVDASVGQARAERLGQWTAMHFYKRALSSPYALECSIQNRLRKICESSDGGASGGQYGLSEESLRTSVIDDDLGEELSEEEVDSRAARLIFGDTDHIELEKQILKSVLDSVRGLRPKRDAKLMKLLREVLPECLHATPRVIVFTRFKDTLDYLEREIRRDAKTRLTLKGLEVFTIHGEIGIPKRKEIFQKFRSSKRAVLITTDCMSEGIDLQYASNSVIHYELPWNPNRLEQRNGRVDRFGQPYESVLIRTFFTLNSIEAKILEVIIRKAETIRSDYGFAPPFFADDMMVLDVLREYGDSFMQTTLTDFLDEREEGAFELESPYTEERIREIREDSLYGQINVDLSDVHEKMEASMKRVGTPEEIQSFVTRAINLLGGELSKTKERNVYNCVLPESLRLTELEQTQSLRVTFDRDLGARDSELHVLDLQSPLVSKLVSLITEHIFLDRSQHYGRVSAVGSADTDEVVAIVHLRLRYLVRTSPVTIIEDVGRIGVEVWGDGVLDQDQVDALWHSIPGSHGRVEQELSEASTRAMHHQRLLSQMTKVADLARQEMIDERTKLRANLESDGLSKGLEGMDEIDLSSIDIVGMTLFFPIQVGGKR